MQNYSLKKNERICNNYNITVWRKKNPGKLGILTDYDLLKNNPNHKEGGISIQNDIYNLPFPTNYIERDYSFNPYRSYSDIMLEDKIFFDNNANLYNYKKKLENQYGIVWKPPVSITHSKHTEYKTPAYQFIYVPDVEHGSYNYVGKLYKASNNYLGRMNQGMPFYNIKYRLNETNLNDILNQPYS